MNKLINVLQASDLTEAPAVRRELVLLRVRSTMQNRAAILKEAEIFGARAVDSSVEGFALEATGDPEKLDEFIDVMRSYGEIDVTRSGLVAVSLEAKKLKLAPPVPRESEVNRIHNGVLQNGNPLEIAMARRVFTKKTATFPPKG